MAQIFSLKNSKFFSGLKKICAIVPTITTGVPVQQVSNVQLLVGLVSVFVFLFLINEIT